MTQQLTFASRYSTDNHLREQLYPLFETVFGIPATTFQDFFARGFWDPTYTPYTFFDGDRAVANVSRFTLPLLINGQRVYAAGIQSVMTDPNYRGQGLMKQLFQRMLEELDQEYELIFLFTEIPDLYQPFGFRQLQEHTFLSPAPQVIKQETALRQMEFFKEEDLAQVRAHLPKRAPLSRQFAPISSESSFYLNMYNPFFNQKLYHSEELQALLVYEVQADTLRLFDVIGEKLPSLEQLCAGIPEPFSQVQFHFVPDQFTNTYEPTLANSQQLMVRGVFAEDNRFVKMPLTAVF